MKRSKTRRSSWLMGSLLLAAAFAPAMAGEIGQAALSGSSCEVLRFGAGGDGVALEGTVVAGVEPLALSTLQAGFSLVLLSDGSLVLCDSSVDFGTLMDTAIWSRTSTEAILLDTAVWSHTGPGTDLTLSE